MQYENQNLYEGNKPYLYVSYAVEDLEETKEIIEHLNQLDFLIWYNDGSNSPEKAQSRLSGCSCFIAIMSKNYIISSRCRDELNTSHSKSKSCVLLYLHEFPLPERIEKSFKEIPNIHKSRFSNNAEFYQKLIQEPYISKCRNSGIKAPQNSVKPSSASPDIAKKSTSVASLNEKNQIRKEGNNMKSESGFLSDPQGKKYGIISLICVILAFMTITSFPFIALILNIIARVAANVAKSRGNNGMMVGFSRIFSMIGIIICSLGVIVIIVGGIIGNTIEREGISIINSFGSTAENWISYLFSMIFDW